MIMMIPTKRRIGFLIISFHDVVLISHLPLLLSSFSKHCYDTSWFDRLLTSLNLDRTDCLSIHNHSQLSLSTTASPPI
ncbi:hypothetical protein BDM02DRAFT_2063215 [Thelephora ganbajun]|uniref:Uncharacterized protein n=1 Tax=Thelephora ganbajun TaxID=370292 RepID=A0ACB6YZN0_THEGA|nr:hypothetical protein BDM02DRAFT_2063215 [Thelephora ganbajun]